MVSDSPKDAPAASIAAIILAAGSSSRMGGGRHKLQLPLGGRPVLLHVIEAARASQARPLLVVLGHEAGQVRALLADYGQELMLRENPDYGQGMSSSIRAGLQALMDDATVGGALIVLGDQPLMTARILDTLIATQRATGRRIVAPLYEGRRGSPVLFDASLFAELMQVTGDEGGRSVLERHREELLTVEMGSATANFDVDTWEAYQQMVQAWQKQQR